MSSPVVLVTGSDKRLPVGWWATRLQLALVGVRARHVTPGCNELPSSVSGVIIGGGDDIEPEHYGASGDAGATYNPERDAMEMAITRRALKADLPLLGICRGAQLLNVVLGGSLYTDIRPMRRKTPNRNSLFRIKWVDLEQRSAIARMLQRNPVRVNSLHNQAIHRVADALCDVGWDKDGFIQAVEAPNRQFVLGVQWHPEYLLWSRAQRYLFKAFSHAVKQHRGIDLNKVMLDEG